MLVDSQHRLLVVAVRSAPFDTVDEKLRSGVRKRERTSRWEAIVEKGRVVRAGNVITGGGVTAGMDFALAAIAEIFGQAVAEDAQLLLEYAPAPPFETVHPDDAPAETTARLRKFMHAGLTADRVAAEALVTRFAVES